MVQATRDRNTTVPAIKSEHWALVELQAKIRAEISRIFADNENALIGVEKDIADSGIQCKSSVLKWKNMRMYAGFSFDSFFILPSNDRQIGSL